MISLSLLEENDFSKIVAWNRNKPPQFIRQWSGTAYTAPLSAGQIRIRHKAEDINKPGSNSFSYRIEYDNRVIGCIDLVHINRIKQKATIAHLLIGNKSDRGKGYGGQAIREIMKIAVQEFGMRSLCLYVYDYNEQAIQCYMNTGFRIKEKFLKAAVLPSGKPAACYYMVNNTLTDTGINPCTGNDTLRRNIDNKLFFQ